MDERRDAIAEALFGDYGYPVTWVEAQDGRFAGVVAMCFRRADAVLAVLPDPPVADRDAPASTLGTPQTEGKGATTGWEATAELFEDERDAALEREQRLREALEVIDAFGCERTFKGTRCFDNDELSRSAVHEADSWCYPCVAAAALEDVEVPLREAARYEPLHEKFVGYDRLISQSNPDAGTEVALREWHDAPPRGHITAGPWRLYRQVTEGEGS